MSNVTVKSSEDIKNLQKTMKKKMIDGKKVSRKKIKEAVEDYVNS